MDERTATMIIMSALSAAMHYQEYIDTGHEFDLIAARQALQNPDLKDWAKDNAALIPLRRDHKSIFEALPNDD